MVCLGHRHNLSAKSSMEVAPDPTLSAAVSPSPAKPLHNFDLPWLRWGNQRHLRCMNVNDSAAGASRRRSEGFRCEPASIAARREQPRRRVQIRGGGEDEEQDGIAAVSRKILGDLKMAAAEMQDAIFRDGAAAGAAAEEDDEEYESGGGEGDVAAGVSAAAAEEEEGEVRPWNLRTRRAACKAPAEDKKVISSSSSPEKAKSAKREKFSAALSKKEIEADFMMLLGHKPPRRPKKRPRNVQRQLDFLFPGSLLGEITADSYKVLENPETGKRQ